MVSAPGGLGWAFCPPAPWVEGVATPGDRVSIGKEKCLT